MRKLWSHSSLAGTASLIGMALIVLGSMAASAPDARAGCNHLGNDGGCPNGITPGSTSVAILPGNVILWSDGNISFGNCCIAPSNTETPGGLHDLTEGAGFGPGAASQFFGTGSSPFGPSNSDVGEGDFYNYQPENYLVTPSERYSLYGSGSPTFDEQPLEALLALFPEGTYHFRDGQTTFGLPDLRGRTPIGSGTTATGPTHVVSAGENLFRIALRYGVSMQAIAAANGIADATSIFAGQVLKIPQAGDTGSTGAAVNVSGGVITGGYLFPVGTAGEVGEEAAGRDVDFFRPLILQFPDDLGRQSLVVRDSSNLDCGTTNSCNNDSIVPLPLSFGSCGETALCSQPTFVQSYQVQEGDTMASIAARHNITVEELAAANFSGGGVPEGVLPTGALMGIPVPSTPQQQFVFTDETAALFDRLVASLDTAPPADSTTAPRGPAGATTPPRIIGPVVATAPNDLEINGVNYGRTEIIRGPDGQLHRVGTGRWAGFDFGTTKFHEGSEFTRPSYRAEGMPNRAFRTPPENWQPNNPVSGIQAQDALTLPTFNDGFAEGNVDVWSSNISDRRLKTDIVRLGALPSGLPVYRFRYIWSAKKHIGVMAQEAMLLYPDAVHEIGGFLAVDYSRIR